MEENPKASQGGGGHGDSHPAAGDLANPPARDHHMIPVWFFVGLILFIYGVIILGTGIYEYSSPPPTVLANTHPAVWWGALLTVIGGMYVVIYRPKKS